jgi:hypothetical protein
MDTANLNQPTPTDAKQRARVVFHDGRRYNTGTLTYWPGAASSRPATVVGDNGRRHHPHPDRVWLAPPLDHP